MPLSLQVVPLEDRPSDALEQRWMQPSQQAAEQSLHERTQAITLTADVVLSLNRMDSLRQMLHECAQSMVTNLDAALARIWTLHEEENILVLEASAGLYAHLDGAHARVPVGSLMIGLIAKERLPHLTNDVQHDPQISDHEWTEREGLVAFAGYPLMANNRLVGVMAMFARHPLSQGHLDAMATAAQQIAGGIERHRVDERLELTQFTIDHVATSVFWTEADGHFFDVNDAACRLTGYTRTELTSLSVWDIDSTITFEGWLAVWQSLHDRGTFDMESGLLCRDGSVVPVGVNSNLLQIDGREFSCTFLQDITARKQAEAAQSESDLRFHEIFSQLQLQIARMPLAYVLFDAEFCVTDWNPAAEVIFGYSKEEVLGLRPPFEVVPRESGPLGEMLLGRMQHRDLAAHSIDDNVTKAGRAITCEWVNTPLTSEQGEFIGLMCLAQDVTERKQLEEQFRQAQKLEAVGRLASGVSHDFNNVLTVILGYCDILQDSLREEDPLREMVNQIELAGNRAAKLTRQLLTFSRKQILAPQVSDLNSLVADIEKMLSRLIGEDITFVFRPVKEPWQVLVDAGQIEQVLMNLVVNSRDAMPQGGTLSIETSNVELDESYAASHADAPVGEYAQLEVADTGCGMDRATLARIFEPFFSTKGEQGTGLGLPTVYGIVKQSGGLIDVSSKPQGGTSVRILLPRAAGSRAAEKLLDGKDKKLRGTETVLLVEDEDSVRSLARITLQRHGYHVLEARHGGEALLLCEQHPGHIDLLATDVVMPHMSGLDLTKRLLPLCPGLRVLYMSGYLDDAVMRHGLLHAEVSFLQKPFSPDALAHKVREVLDGSA